MPLMRPLERTRRNRLAVAALIGVAFGIVNFRYAQGTTHWRPDFDHLWYGSRALLAGRDPYPLIGPGRAFDWPFRLNYPLPALLLLAPLAVLPLTLARFLFVGGSVGLLAFVLSRDGAHRLLLLMSAAAFHAAIRAQWSPLLVAALLVPSLRVVYVAKPTIALALWLSRPSRLPIIAGALLGGVSFALVPRWPIEWFAATHATPFFVYALLPGGALLLAALVRWRDPDARLVAALACVPQTTVAYETLYLGAILSSRRALLAWSLLTWAAWIAQGPASTYAQKIHDSATLNLWLVYAPTVAIVLSRFVLHKRAQGCHVTEQTTLAD